MCVFLSFNLHNIVEKNIEVSLHKILLLIYNKKLSDFVKNIYKKWERKLCSGVKRQKM
ncbi:MAG: hypothetical protein K0S51_2131 [Bacillales bacterium]|nr:hypothetical protein [Bacillales bacterium]